MLSTFLSRLQRCDFYFLHVSSISCFIKLTCQFYYLKNHFYSEKIIFSAKPTLFLNYLPTWGHVSLPFIRDFFVCEGEKPMKCDCVFLHKTSWDQGAQRHSSKSYALDITASERCLFFVHKMKVAAIVILVRRCESYLKILLHFIFTLPQGDHRWAVKSPFYR